MERSIIKASITQSSVIKTGAYMLVALVAFAANSVLCRWALAEGAIDPYSFTLIRVVSGAVTLLGLVLVFRPKGVAFKAIRNTVSPQATAALLIYMFCFSFAYIQLGAGLGALVLFVAVQFTMILMHLKSGNRMSHLEWFGTLCSIGGFIYLVSPNSTDTALELPSILLMMVAGVSWGFYTLFGKKAEQPLVTTMVNFIVAAPITLVLYPLFSNSVTVTSQGAIYAVMSGSLASGMGYALWYKILTNISTVVASVAQLSVPVIATVGGVLLLSEPLTVHFSISSGIILLGIGCVILSPVILNKSIVSKK